MAWKPLIAVAVSVAAAAGVGGILLNSGSFAASDFEQFNTGEVKIAAGKAPEAAKPVEKKAEVKAEEKKEVEKAEVDLKGDKVDNLRTDANSDQDFCKDSKLKAGEGKTDKGGTCLSVPVGEIAKNPVKVAISGIPDIAAEGKDLKVNIKIEDKFGPLDLNAFTFDESGKAGKAFLEGPGELDNDGRPLIHCHLGISTLKERDGLPGDKYDAAFTGVQGLKGDVNATIKGLQAGVYRADVYCSQSGHLSLPTAKADNVQAFDSVEFEVK